MSEESSPKAPPQGKTSQTSYWQIFRKTCVICWRLRLVICICVIAWLSMKLVAARTMAQAQRASAASDLNAMKTQRDDLAKKLQPFADIANRQYPRSPENQRLDILAKEVAIVAQHARAVAAQQVALAQNDPLPAAAVDRIKQKLDYAEHLKVRVVSTSKDNKVVMLAAKIAQIFKECGFEVSGVDLLNNFPANGVTVTSKKPLKGPMNDALKQLYTEVNQDPSIKVGKGLSDADLEIVVGDKDASTAQSGTK